MSILRRIVENKLDEAQNYESMFNDLFKWNTIENMKRVNPADADIWDNDIGIAQEVAERTQMLKGLVGEQIAWARAKLKKNDRIIWYLRWVKAMLFHYYAYSGTGYSKNQPFVKTWFENNKKLFNPNAEMWAWEETAITMYREPNSSRVENWRNEIVHHLSLTTCHKIQNHVWSWETPADLLNLFFAYEEEWAKEREGKIDADPSLYKEIVMQFPGDWCWVDLGRGACSAEAKAMGHCGNEPTVQEGETILSLRKLVKNGPNKFWEPHLTFILDRSGYLGEMKGRANEKPAQKYHQYITALLKTDKVKGLKGGGYAPESNFSMADLPTEERMALIEQKPGLLDMKSANIFFDHDTIGPTAKQVIFRGIFQGFSNYHRFMVDKGEGLPMNRGSLWWIAKWSSAEGVFDRLGTQADSDMFNSYVNGADDMDHDYRTYPETFEDYEGFIPYKPALYDHLINYCTKKYGELYTAYCDANDIEEDDSESAIGYLVENDTEFQTLVRESIDAGYDKGFSDYVKQLVEVWMEDGLEIRYGSENDGIPIHAVFLNDRFDTEDDILFGINELDYEFRRLLKDDKAWAKFVDNAEDAELEFNSTATLDDEWKERAAQQDGGSASTEHFLAYYKHTLRIP